MLLVKKHGVILSPTKLEFESRAVLNPGILKEGNHVHMVYRAVDEKHISSIGYARLKGPLEIEQRWKHSFMKPSYKYESMGMEDPRLTRIGKNVYMTYVAHDGKNAQIAYAEGSSVANLKKGGLIGPKIRYDIAGKHFRQNKLKDDYYFFESFYKTYNGSDILIWEKDAILWPEKIKGKFVLTHRILPDIQIAYFKKFADLKKTSFWADYLEDFDHNVLLEGRHGWEERHIGGGAPPIKTKEGWLMIYHGVEETNKQRTYHAGVALLDLKDPSRLIARLPYPLFSPEESYELAGDVDNVVFPTGTALFKDELYIYYGAADSHIAVASLSLHELLIELRRHKGDLI
jgi:predicted GH43/DUF377 family glycosyl hydrolase